MSRAWQGGNTRRWRALRKAILERDGYRCRVRIEGICKGIADCVHHTEGKAVTGDDPRYLVASCTPCNLKIGDPNRRNPPSRQTTDW